MCWFTVVWMVLFGRGVTLVSKNGMEPSVPGCSTVNCVLGSCELMWCSSCVQCSALWMTPWLYIGESGRIFEDRYKEHLKAPSPIHLHTTTTGHPVSPYCFSVVDRDSQGMVRNIKEAMYIRVNDPSLNRNLGKFQLSHVWDQVLQDTPTLHLK